MGRFQSFLCPDPAVLCPAAPRHACSGLGLVFKVGLLAAIAAAVVTVVGRQRGAAADGGKKGAAATAVAAGQMKK